ncbi:MAG TPA: hypothetical protein VK932_06435 [Kofleriaceae bacterium]|nr:hypothetical protein [Kofleriaceae bacterium]
MRGTCLLAVLLAACSFSSPEVAPGDGAPGDGSGSGTDAPPACVDGDDDGDTVCNAVDRCPGHDDRADVDGDGNPDGCDDWPCGLKPNDPGSNMTDGQIATGRSWGANNIQIGTMRRLVVAPGAMFDARFDWWVLLKCVGDTCSAQVEIGYGTTRSSCIFDGTVNDLNRYDGRFEQQFMAPPTSGVHELRLNAGRNAACGMGTSWYAGDPGSDSTIAILCVR